MEFVLVRSTRFFYDTCIITDDSIQCLIGEGAMAAVLYGARKNLRPIIVGKPHQPLLDVVHEA